MNEARVVDVHPAFAAIAEHPSNGRLLIFADITSERRRQEQIYGERSIASPELEQSQRLAVLAEEFGEVARKVLDLEDPARPSVHFVQDLDDLKEELTQVAAVCVGWLEALS